MAASSTPEDGSRLESWIPLDMEGKPLYHGIDETERMNKVRPNITRVRTQWNDPQGCQALRHAVEETLNATTLSRELLSELHHVLDVSRYWADHQRFSGSLKRASLDQTPINYGALELYTTNSGYKKIFGYINQIFRVVTVDESMIQGAVALVELLTIDVYNLRLNNYGLAQYFNFQGVVHRGMKVSNEVLQAFSHLLSKPLKDRNFSVPLTFVSTTADEKNIQEFLNHARHNEKRLHWKIHVRELDPGLLASYRQEYPDSVVSTICAMPISSVSEYPDEKEVLLRGPSFQLLRMYEAEAADKSVCVLEMVMLNTNRDHGTELAHHHEKYKDQRQLFGRMCAATKYEICASLAEEYGLREEARQYSALLNETLHMIGHIRTDTSFATAHYNVLATLRPSWIGASLTESFPKFYAQRRAAFSKALYGGKDWSLVEKIIDDEYECQKSDWCNVPRLYEEDTREEANNSSGFTALHQAAYNNASPALVQKLVELGGWRTMKAHQRGHYQTPRGVAIQRENHGLVPLFEPKIHHRISLDDLESIERHVHALMTDLAGAAINQFSVTLPQLSVMTEIEVVKPSLWVPIPGICGGFIITLHPSPMPIVHVVLVSNAFPREEKEYWINRGGLRSLGSKE